jgi:HlyD family secretion protein
MRLLITSLGLVGLAAAAASLSAGFENATADAAATARESAARKYTTAEVTVGRIERKIAAIGSLQAVSTVKVSSQLSGQIADLYVNYNDMVQTDQPLAVLDQRGYRARVAQARAELEMARETVSVLSARLAKAHGVEQEMVARRQIHAARIEKAQVRLDAAQQSLDRTEALARRGTLSGSAAEDAHAEHLTAVAELSEVKAAFAAQEHVIAASKAGRQEVEAELANARAALSLRRAALDLAELDLDRSTIRAPTDGVIINRNVEKGQTVATSLDAPTLFTIAGDLSEMEIHANIDETDIGEIGVGQTAEFSVGAFPGRAFPARVIELRKGAKLVQGVVSYVVILRVENRQGLLLPGMTAKLNITVQEYDAVPTLPLAALRYSPNDRAIDASPALPTGDGTAVRTVWVLDDRGLPKPQSIEIGVDDGRDVAIPDADLPIGTRVITGSAQPTEKKRVFGIRF